jgi:anti-sigma factor RsiW
MSCRELVELVTAYLDDALSAAERARFEAHVAECGECATYIAQLADVAKVAGTLTEADIPPEALSALLPVFREVKR